LEIELRCGGRSDGEEKNASEHCQKNDAK
jgi:hypothetical protein